MHHRRHRTIATLVKQIEAYDDKVSSGQTKVKPSKSKLSSLLHLNTPLPPTSQSLTKLAGLLTELHLPADGEMTWEEKMLRLSRRERESILTNEERWQYDLDGITAQIQNSFTLDNDELAPRTPLRKCRDSFQSPSTPLSRQDSALTKKAAKKARRAAEYAADNEEIIVNNEFLDFIAEALHGCKIMDKGCTVMEDMDDDNIKSLTEQFKNEAIFKENVAFQQFNRNKMYKYGRQTRVEKENAERLAKLEKVAVYAPAAPGFLKPNFVDIDSTTRFDTSFFVRLKIKFTNPHDNSRERREMVAKLAKEINADIDVAEREEKGMKMRQAGFWRYVNGTAAENLKDAHLNFSWATGELKKERKLRESSAESEDFVFDDVKEHGVDEERSDWSSTEINLDGEGDQDVLSPETARAAYKTVYAAMEQFLEDYNAMRDSYGPRASDQLEQLCTFMKDEAKIFDHFRINLDKLCATVKEKSEVKLTVKRELLTNVGTRTNITRLRYQTLEVPIICLYEDEQLTEEIKKEKARRAEEAKNKPITFKIINFARTPRASAPSTPLPSLPRSTTMPNMWTSMTTSSLAVSSAAKAAARTPAAAQATRKINPQPPGSSPLPPKFGTPVQLAKLKKKGPEDDWEAVLPARPPVKTKNAFDVLQQIEE